MSSAKKSNNNKILTLLFFYIVFSTADLKAVFKRTVIALTFALDNQLNRIFMSWLPVNIFEFSKHEICT